MYVIQQQKNYSLFLQEKYNAVCTCYPVKAKREEKEKLLKLEEMQFGHKLLPLTWECGLGLSQKFQMCGCGNWEGILNHFFSH
jgi:hypothetical protein